MLCAVRYRVLGSVDVLDPSGAPVALESAKQRTLLALLLARPGSAVSADRMTDVLWGDDIPADPAGALQSQISRLRRRLPPGDELVRRGGAYVLEADTDDIDAVRFERLVDESSRQQHPADRLLRLDEALRLWRGDAFGELGSDPAFLGSASRLDDLRAAARMDRADALLELGRAPEAAAEADELARELPHDERPVVVLMRSLHQAGRQADALRAYQRFRTTLADELGLDPSPALRALEGEILRHEVAEPVHPALESGPAPEAIHAALPSPATAFIGRRAELAAVVDLLGRVRLVTLTGPGGVGKTRLGLEAARRADEGEEAAFCDLSTIDDASSVAESVATSLGVQHAAGQTLVARLVDVLGARPLLLVLDNCEHVIDGAAELVDRLVREAKNVRVLATSRIPLAIDGEHRVALQPLGVDGDSGGGGGDALALLLDRVQAVRSDLAVAPGFLEDAAHIVRRVDGLPLAVELAAARLAVASPAEVRRELDERLASLASPRRAAPRRHRSIAALVQWSYEQLTPSEAEAFDHFAVFPGGASPEAVAAVLGRPVAGTRVDLEGLVEQSLLVRQEVVGRSRFGALDTLRAFADERMAERGAVDGARDRLADYLAERAEQLQSEITSGTTETAMAELDAELPNLRVAHHRLLERGDAEGCLRLHAALVWYAMFNDHSEVFAWAEEAATRFPGPRRLLPRVLASASFGAWRRGDLHRAERLARSGIDGAVEEADAALAWGALGDALVSRGELDEAIPCYERGVELSSGEPAEEALALANLALTVGYAGDHERAQRIVGESLAITEGLEAGMAHTFARYARGEVLMDRDPEAAREDLGESLRMAERMGASFLAGVAGLSAVSVEVRVGDPDDALDRFPVLLERWSRAGTWNQLWTGVRVLAEALCRVGRDEAAARLMGIAESRQTSSAVFGEELDRQAAVRATLIERLGPSAFTACHGTGAALDDPAALAATFQVLDERPP